MPQGDLTASAGWKTQDELKNTLANVLSKEINNEDSEQLGILKHNEGFELLPSNIELEAIELSLVNVMSREYVLDNLLSKNKEYYDYIIIDCRPSLGMLTMNALAASDSVIIPVQAQYLPVKGMTQLLETVNKIKFRINPKLKIDGILLNIVDRNTNLTKNVIKSIHDNYGQNIKIFNTVIPKGTKVAEESLYGKSIFEYDKKSKQAIAYENLAKEVIEAVIGSGVAFIFNSSGNKESEIANTEIVLVAKSQIGNEGGDKFWQWYGFNEHVEWCACFVSWCANECGYIDKGIIPKFSYCDDAIKWFDDKEEWHSRNDSYFPMSGDLIFFDWKDEDGNQDGISDHVGIVTKIDVENKKVYTIEGNTSNQCAERIYLFDDIQIMGYGSPKYK